MLKECEELAAEIQRDYFGKTSGLIEQESDIAGILESINAVISDLGKHDSEKKACLRMFGTLIDGNTSSIESIAHSVEEKLKLLNVETSPLPKNFAATLIYKLATCVDLKSKSLKDTYNKYFELKDLEILKSGKEFEDLLRCSMMRKRSVEYMMSLERMIRWIDSSKAPSFVLNNVKNAEKRKDSMKKRLEREKKRVDKQDGGNTKEKEEEKRLRFEERKQQMENKRKENEEKKKRDIEEKARKEEAKNEERKMQEQIKKEQENEKREKREKEKEEKRAAAAEKLRREELEKKEREKREAAGAPLTMFFGKIIPKIEPKGQEGGEMVQEGLEGAVSIWKKGLGSLLKFSNWDTERREEFDLIFERYEERKSIKIDTLNLSLKDQIKDLKKETRRSLNQMDIEPLAQARKIFIKYEDYLSDNFEYKGRSLLKIRGVQEAVPNSQRHESDSKRRRPNRLRAKFGRRVPVGRGR